jgi:hypothetical protein
MAGEPALLSYVRLEHAEPARKIDLLLWAQVLISEEHDFVVEKRPRELGEGGVVERL